MKILHKIVSIIVAVTLVSGMVFGMTAFARDGVVNVDLLNVRKYPSADADIIDRITMNTMVNAYDCDEDGWFIINHNDGYAYVMSQYITFKHPEYTSPEKVYFEEVRYGKANAHSLNVRNGATVDCTIVDNVDSETPFELFGEENGFFITKVDGIERFIPTQYVDAISKEEYADKLEEIAKNEDSIGDDIVEEALKYIGTPYVYGGSSPRGFDCSGFTSYVYKQFDVKLNRTASGQASNGESVSKSELQPGDIVLFGPYRGGGIGHAGIYIGDGNMVHAPKPGLSVRVESINSSYYASRYVGARRIFD